VNKCIINPKALNIKELYGSYDLVAFEWTDGVISSIFKNFSESSKYDVEKWLIFDGPVDAMWIESMNSVKDDNKILTLVNSDRASLTASMSLLFEVENLSVTSPATVSRAGMIYIDGHIGWKPFLQSWLHKNIDLFQGSRTIIDELCDKVSLLLIYYLFSFVQITNNTSSTCLTSTI
jgi:dynein heavy chain